MGCAGSVPKPVETTTVMPKSVELFCNGEPMAGKAEKFMGDMVADSYTLEFVGAHVHPALAGKKLDKAAFGGAAKNLIDSFPDLTFNFTKATPKRNADGSWAADIVVMGTHTGAAFSPMPGKLPAVEKTDKCVKIGPETFTLWVDGDGKVCKLEITPLGAGHPHGPPGFYLEIGGVIPPPAPETLFCTAEFDPEKPTKDMDGALMWVQKYGGKQFMRISIPVGFDWVKTAAPMLPKDAEGKCPEWCPATHFGYLESGEMGVEFKDGSKKTVKAGESYLVPPGHRPVMDKAAVMIEFSQDPTWVKAVGAEATAAPPVKETPPEAFVCQPCENELGAPTKEFDGAKMWVTKAEGKQFMRIAIPAGFDWLKSAAPMLPKDAEGNCPEWCPATHFGYLESGEMGVEFKDGSKKTVKAGESYLVGPGHRPVMDKPAVMIEFSQDPTWVKAVEASK